MEQVAEILQSPNALRVLDVYGSVERITCSHYHFAVSRRSRRQAWCRRELAWSALRVVVTGVILPSLWGSSLLIFFRQNRRMPRREEGFCRSRKGSGSGQRFRFSRGRSYGYSSDSSYIAAVEAGQLIAVTSIVDRKSTRLNSSHRTISYSVFCLKKKTVHS